MTFLIAALLAFALWLAAEIPLVCELLRRLRTGPRALPVLLLLCALLDIAGAALGGCFLHAAAIPSSDLGWETALPALFMSVVPFAYLWLLVLGGMLCFMADTFGGAFLVVVLVLPPVLLYCHSPFLRYRLLARAPVPHPRRAACLAFFTAYLPLLPVAALLAPLLPHS